MLAHNGTSGIDNIGEYAGRTKKNIILTCDACIKRDIVLHFYIIAQYNARCDKHVLTYVAIFSNSAATHNVREMPDASAFTYYSVLINYTCRMCKISSTHNYCVKIRKKKGCKISKQMNVVK